MRWTKAQEKKSRKERTRRTEAKAKESRSMPKPATGKRAGQKKSDEQADGWIWKGDEQADGVVERERLVESEPLADKNWFGMVDDSKQLHTLGTRGNGSS